MTNNSNLTVILGASTNPVRYSYIAAQKLIDKDYPIFLLGAKPGTLFNETIHTEFPNKSVEIDTITVYLSVKHQKGYYKSIVDAKPKRVIFNPGSENHELAALLKENEINVQFACTLVLISTGQY